MVIEYFPVGSLIFFILPEVFLGGATRHLIDDFRERAHDQAATAKRTRAVSSGKDPDQAIQRLRRENEELRRLIKIYAESIRQLTLDHLELETKLHAAADIAVLPSHRSR